MENSTYGHFDFSIGWKTKITLMLFRKKYEVTLKLQAYTKNEDITAKQQNALEEFKALEKEKIGCIERLLNKFDTNSDKRFSPKTLLFQRDGSYALLCDDKQNLDEGIAIVLSPTEEILSQDDYL